MIKIYDEVELESFEAWSGGSTVLDKILDHEESDEILEFLTDYVNDIFNGECTETQLNDFLWFDADEIIEEHLDIDIYE